MRASFVESVGRVVRHRRDLSNRSVVGCEARRGDVGEPFFVWNNTERHLRHRED